MPAPEYCLRVSATYNRHPVAVLLVPPLFDEANRLRRTLVLTMRALAELGHDCLLPDLPGQNESVVATEDATLERWKTALCEFGAELDQPVIVASWRGGALIDDAVSNAVGWWRMAPISGASLLKTMVRTRIAREKEAGRMISADELRASADDEPLELAGNRLSKAMRDQLDTAIAADVLPLRAVHVGTPPERIAGTALWLRAEPSEDAAMAKAMATDIADWARQCGDI